MNRPELPPLEGAQPAAPRDTSFYAARQKIYPRAVNGPYARVRVVTVLALLGLYYFLPWLTLDGRQAVLFDLPARKFHLFGLTLWPQDFFYLALLLMLAALALFFFTAIAGRLWCGYACPQTVWAQAFLWIEHGLEGDRARRMKLDSQPWNARKLAIKGAKHGAWLVLALWTGFTFVGYFTPIRELAHAAVTFSTGPWETFWILFYSFATWGNAGFLREQVCIYMCPYARFQSAMFDKDTLIISYDPDRGEPRGSRKKGADYRAQGLGECVDCGLCRQVCPMGIDIRDGLQYQCIGCTSCVDVCNNVMQKLGYAKGLIRYTTENALTGRAAHILRPRVLIYGSLLMVFLGGIVWGLANRVPLELDVMRDRRALYREAADGLIENVYTLKILNMDNRPHRYRLAVSGVESATLDAPAEIAVVAGEVQELPVRVRVDPAWLHRSNSEIRFELSAIDSPDLVVREPARFLGPRTNSGG
jgi:cytochrome c oxidase accessory protein FixG